MTSLLWFTAGWWSCSLSFCIALVLRKIHRPKPPTLRRRKHRDSPERNQVGELREGVEPEPHEPFYMYGVTGLEDQ